MSINNCSVMSRQFPILKPVLSSANRALLKNTKQSSPLIISHMLQRHGSYMFVNFLLPMDNCDILLHLSPSLIIYGLYADNKNNNNKNTNRKIIKK